jgi:hypothetical protein
MDPPIEVNFRVSGGRPVTPRFASELSRALLKTAFGCSWLEHGEALLAPEWDSVRKAVLGEPRDGYIVIPRNPRRDHVNAEMWGAHAVLPDGQMGLTVVAKLYGIGLATDSYNATVALPKTDFMVVTFTGQDTKRRTKAA